MPFLALSANGFMKPLSSDTSMKSLPSFTLAVSLFLFQVPAAQAGKIYDWDFTTMSAVDSVNGVTATLGNAGGLSAMGYTILDAMGQGITVNQPANLAVTGTWTIEIVFSLDNDDVNYQKIIDFRNYGEDEGMYVRNAYFRFYDYAEANLGGTDFSAGEELTFVISRNAATKKIYLQVNGVRIWSFIDFDDYGLFDQANNVMHFFQDDDDDGENPKGGIVKSIRVYNRALTDSVEIAAAARKCKKLKKALKNATRSGKVAKVKRAKKALKKCTKQLKRLRATSSVAKL